MSLAVSVLANVEKDYERLSRAALTIAEEYFDSKKVLWRLLDQALG